MTNDIREKAEALIYWIDNQSADSRIYDCKEYTSLKAALRPSRQEIADYLENHNAWRRGEHNDSPEPKELGKYLELATEELRK